MRTIASQSGLPRRAFPQVGQVAFGRLSTQGGRSVLTICASWVQKILQHGHQGWPTDVD